MLPKYITFIWYFTVLYKKRIYWTEICQPKVSGSDIYYFKPSNQVLHGFMGITDRMFTGLLSYFSDGWSHKIQKNADFFIL